MEGALRLPDAPPFDVLEFTSVVANTCDEALPLERENRPTKPESALRP